MPRNVSRTRAPKRRTKWCGVADDFNVPNIANNAVGDAVALCEATNAVNDQADPVVGWCRGSISIARLTATDSAISVIWAIVLGRLDPGFALPIQTFDPFNNADLERQDILGMGNIPVPPVVLQADNTAVVNRSSSAVEVNIRVGRKLARNTNNIFLWIVSSGLDNGMTARVSIRTLMKF